MIDCTNCIYAKEYYSQHLLTRTLLGYRCALEFNNPPHPINYGCTKGKIIVSVNNIKSSLDN